MRKTLLITLLIVLFFTISFSIRLGVQLQNWNGYVQNQYMQAVRVSQTAPGYPAYNNLFPGDIITEAVMLPNSQIWANPNMPGQGTIISLNPYYPLNQQLHMLGQYSYNYRYSQLNNYQTILNFINTAPYQSNIVMRIFRPQWNSWTLISVVLDSSGGGNIWTMPGPGQQPQVVPNQPNQQPQVVPNQPNQPQVQINPNIQLRIWLRF